MPQDQYSGLRSTGLLVLVIVIAPTHSTDWQHLKKCTS